MKIKGKYVVVTKDDLSPSEVSDLEKLADSEESEILPENLLLTARALVGTRSDDGSRVMDPDLEVRVGIRDGEQVLTVVRHRPLVVIPGQLDTVVLTCDGNAADPDRIERYRNAYPDKSFRTIGEDHGGQEASP